MNAILTIAPDVRRFLDLSRVAHLATADASGNPSVVPICFHIEGARLYSVIDAKPKRAAMPGGAKQLQRVRNILANPSVAVVVDRWDEAWSRLGWVLLRGSADLIEAGADHQQALEWLRMKYPQYRSMALENHPVIRMEIESVRTWGDLALTNAELDGA